MIAITKDEKEIIHEKFPKVHIVRTMKQDSKRHHYFCEESRGVMKYLDSVRNASSHNKGGEYYTDSKERK